VILRKEILIYIMNFLKAAANRMERAKLFVLVAVILYVGEAISILTLFLLRQCGPLFDPREI